MIEMNPFYAHQSAVGPVFDVATWSRGKTSVMALVALLFGALVVTALIFAWQPTFLLQNPPQVLEDLHKETLKLADDNPWTVYGGPAFAAFVAWLALSAAIASAVDAVRGEYYFRVGPGGLSLRIPHGLDFSRLCLTFKRFVADLPMAELADWAIVQHKQLGSTSRNTENATAFLKLRFADGREDAFNLDCFREPAHVIHSKIDDALQMVPAQLGSPDHAPFAKPRRRSTTGVEFTLDTIQETLSNVIRDPSHNSSPPSTTKNAPSSSQSSGSSYQLAALPPSTTGLKDR